MENKLETRSVLFVEQSKGGELAKRLREIERKVNRIVWYNTKELAAGSKTSCPITIHGKVHTVEGHPASHAVHLER